jgi:diaminopimelate epimerase
MISKLPFFKIQGTRNSFVVLDRVVLKEDYERICSHWGGLGSDGLMIIKDTSGDQTEVEMWNPDGTEMGMCGNGARCVVRFLCERNGARSLKGIIKVKDRLIEYSTSDGGKNVSVNLGKISFLPADVPVVASEPLVNAPFESPWGELRVTALSVGNPHVVLFRKTEEHIGITTLGPWFEKHERFPNRTNLELVQIYSPKEISVTVWERGVGRTLACGSGAVASVAAGFKNGLVGTSVDVFLPGGKVHVDLKDDNGILTGETEVIATGELYGKN